MKLASSHLLVGVRGGVQLMTDVLLMDPGMKTRRPVPTGEGGMSFSVLIFCLFFGLKHKPWYSEPIEQGEEWGRGSLLRKAPPLQFSLDPGRLGAGGGGQLMD